jgi:hypothetical protein
MVYSIGLIMVASNLDNVLSIEIRMCVRRQKTFSNVHLLCTRSAAPVSSDAGDGPVSSIIIVKS